ncbi:MAG: GTA baseplate fiber-binding domain-containing protein [Parasphingopyxis sp.]|uniref:phage tail protein n=1 Tax=Parasphingopyxis sp. TaxID=1920299 RepID=UPI003FA1271B
MATLILGTVGTALFGPLGGALGAIIGQQVDNAVFKPGGREGPRLNDLRLQTSSYGTPIPKVFGTMRVAGTVVWATDLQEDRNREGGGKGRPRTTTYSYSASFAVALSARPIRAVHRIWADGKLLRGAAGDFKSETGFRLYPGDERQPVDPLIAAAEGGGGSPAYRGLALAVFENCQLADFGNRIPSLTFEVEADAGPVSFADIAADLSAGNIAAESGATLAGYAAHGESLGAAIETLIAALPHHRIDEADTLRFSDARPDPVVLPEDALGAKPGEQGAVRYRIDRQGADRAAAEIIVRYYEPERDYQTGAQRAWMEGAGRAAERIDLPATVSSARAKAIAEARLERSWAEQAVAAVALPWSTMTVRPGDIVRIPDAAGEWRVAGFGLERMAVSLDLVRLGPAGAVIADTATSGRVVSDPDLEHGPTRLQLLDLPALDDTLHVAPQLLVAAAGPSPGWRSAALEISYDGGASFESLGRTAPPAVMGTASGVLEPGETALFDAAGSIEVDLLNGDMWLAGATDGALVSGANLAALGDELLQFGRAEALGGNRFRLSRLLRGRRGTEWAATTHVSGERFVLIEPATMKTIDAPASALGGPVECLAAGLGDVGAPVSVSAIVEGRQVRPPAPVHLTARRLADGSIRFAWVRRSRLGWAWTSGSDTPLGEETERWRIAIEPATGQVRTAETISSAYLYDLAAQAADGTQAVAGFTLSVTQLGALAESDPPARAVFTL